MDSKENSSVLEINKEWFKKYFRLFLGLKNRKKKRKREKINISSVHRVRSHGESLNVKCEKLLSNIIECKRSERTRSPPML